MGRRSSPRSSRCSAGHLISNQRNELVILVSVWPAKRPISALLSPEATVLSSTHRTTINEEASSAMNKGDYDAAVRQSALAKPPDDRSHH